MTHGAAELMLVLPARSVIRSTNCSAAPHCNYLWAFSAAQLLSCYLGKYPAAKVLLFCIEKVSLQIFQDYQIILLEFKSPKSWFNWPITNFHGSRTTSNWLGSYQVKNFQPYSTFKAFLKFLKCLVIIFTSHFHECFLLTLSNRHFSSILIAFSSKI